MRWKQGCEKFVNYKKICVKDLTRKFIKIYKRQSLNPHTQSREFEPFFDRYRLLKIDLKILMMADWLKVFNKIINTLVFKIKLSVRFNSKIFFFINVTGTSSSFEIERLFLRTSELEKKENSSIAKIVSVNQSNQIKMFFSFTTKNVEKIIFPLFSVKEETM